ncbi:MAG: 50S ribosomal protein L4 [Alphaproteobacteria bacterium]|nr:50S ribosomal protein L4 [Alphaproteobacteria bacterium]
MKVNVVTLDNGKAGTVELSDTIYGLPSRPDILHQVVRWQLAKRQAGTHKTKDIAEVSGTGKKPYKQKGTGHARQGSLRSPQFRGGAIIFGPQVRSHAFALNKKIRTLGLKTALSDKQREGKLFVVDEAKLAGGKTNALAKKMKAMGWESALIIDGETVDEGLARAVTNLKSVDVLPSVGANVYDILRRDVLVLTKAAVEQLEKRLS